MTHSANTQQRLALVILWLSAGLFYVLADIRFNPFILWTALPLYASYGLLQQARKNPEKTPWLAAWLFLLFSVAFSLFYHWAWYTDWEQTRSGDSTSAVIFFIFPVWALVAGAIGWGLGKAWVRLKKRFLA